MSIFCRVAQKIMHLLVLTAMFSAMLCSTEGTSSSGEGLSAQPDTAGLTFQLPGGIPLELTNFTGGLGNSSEFLVGLFVGVGQQEYTFNGTTWVNTNVSAGLYNSSAMQVAHHFFLEQDIGGGVATWVTSNPPSQITGAPAVKIPQTAAVPLLLLNATFNSGANTSSPTCFGGVTHVQRLQTLEGLPPTFNGTDGQIFDSSYSALYAFYQVPK